MEFWIERLPNSDDPLVARGRRVTLQAPFKITGTCASLGSLGKRLAGFADASDLNTCMTVHVEGTDVELEAIRAQQEIRDEERILALAAEIMKRRDSKT